MPFIVDPGGAASSSDRRRIVRISAAGTVTTVRDLENASTFFSVANSFTVTPGQRRQSWAQSSRRYGGARQTGETHDNGAIGWKMLVKGATADACLANVEAVLGDLESPTLDLFLEWRPANATYSTFYELRGNATWKPTYEWAQFQGAQSMYVDVQLPVAPLCYFASQTINISSTVLPAAIALGTTILGDAPAVADITLTHSGGTNAPIFALIGWTKRPGTPLASSVAPFGVIEGESAGTATTWSSTVDASYRGGSGLQTTTVGVGSATALYAVDPSTMVPDAYSFAELDVEVWACVRMASTVVAPKIVLSLEPFAGTSFGQPLYSAEHGSAGKQLTNASSGTVKRFVRLGTLSMPVDPETPLKHNVKVAASWSAGSSGVFGLDYLVLVPARQRALGPTAKANDSAYPKFIASTSATSKTIRSDLSGRVASGGGNPGRDCGLGGSLIELPPGNVDLVIKLSSLVPDDPTADATTEQLSHTVTGVVKVTPRGWLARAA